MRFGVALTPSEPPDEFIASVRLAEELGFDSIWIPDYRLYRDVYVSLTLAALNTTHIRLGCAVTNPYTRHPALTAVGIASVDAISNGRTVLGLGPGGVVLSMLQIERHRPLQACRNTIEDIRGYLGNAAATNPSNVQLDFPTRADLPIFVAATGKQMLMLAGAMADGVIVNVGAHKACVETALAAVAQGARSVKRPRQSIEMLCWLQGCAVSDNEQAALNEVKPKAALTLAHAPGWMLEAMSINEDDVYEIRTTYYTKGPQAAAKLVSDEMVERFNVAGTPKQVRHKIKRLQAQGFDEIIFLLGESGANIRPAMRTLAETVMPELSERITHA